MFLRLATFFGQGAERSVSVKIWNLLSCWTTFNYRRRTLYRGVTVCKVTANLVWEAARKFSVSYSVSHFLKGKSNIGSVSSHMRKSTKLDTTYPILHTVLTDRHRLIRHRTFKTLISNPYQHAKNFRIKCQVFHRTICLSEVFTFSDAWQGIYKVWTGMNAEGSGSAQS
jgi:hypothetical protein